MTEPHEVASKTPAAGRPESPAAQVFVGKWRGLVSTTNWQKGEIIIGWRQALIDGGADPQEYSDEAWSQLVGDVTPQHVGRLRRVYERYGRDWQSYEGLYWTHFLAAIDWDDAEMWLEGALQNGWSVAKMRNQRWETLGSLPADQPLEADIVSDESDLDPFLEEAASDLVIENIEPVQSLGETERTKKNNEAPRDVDDDPLALPESIAAQAPVKANPLESLDDLPTDFVEAFEDFKLVILSHKLAGWRELSPDDVLSSLESLRMLVLET